MSTALDERYGRTPSRARRTRIIGIAAAIAFVGVFGAWLLWGSSLTGSSGVEVRTVGSAVVDENEIRIRWQATVEPGTPISCALQVLNESFGVVGWKIVELPPSSERSRTFTDTVRTAEPAATGLIYRCWLS